MAQTRLTQKELRAPDVFQKAGGEARDWLQHRQRLVVGVVVGLLVLGGLAAVASYASSRKDARAEQELGAALRVLGRPLQADKEPGTGEDGPPFPTAEAKDEAIIEQLGAFRASHLRSRASITAILPLAEAELRLGRPDAALAHFREFLEGTSPRDALAAEALEGEGYAHEAKGQLDEAAAAFERMSHAETEFLAGMGLYHRARILAAQGKRQEAADAFALVVSAHPGTSAQKLSQDRLATLAALGVRPTPVPSTKPDGGSP